MLIKKPLYPFLFILFYLASNAIEVRKLISISYFLSTFSYCIIALLIIAACSYPFYKTWKKCFLFSFIALFFYLQYGSIHEAALSVKALSPITHHSVFIFLFIALILGFFFFIKRLQLNERIIYTLNIVYIFLTVFITIKFIYIDTTEKSPSHAFPNWTNTRCDTCKKPDIFLIVYDEYASSISLKRRFDFDNTGLDSFLRAENFQIQVNSKSNYQNTDCSMLSFFNADYLPIFKTKNYYTKKESLEIEASFRKTNFIAFLQNNQYNINNYSFFSLLKNGREPENSPVFSSHLLLAKSLYYQLTYDGIAFIIKYKLYKNIFKSVFYHQQIQAEEFKANFLKKIISAPENANPSFYYLHQISPHSPFYFDKDGNENNFEELVSSMAEIYKGYVEYIQYCNKKIIELIKKIKKATNNNAVIIFMGDHGLRKGLKANDKEFFANQNAIYFPDHDYHLLYDSISNVNLPRILMNKYFNANIPLLKDSSIHIIKK